MSTTTKALLKEKLQALQDESKGALQKVIVCLELPFVVEEKEIKKFFAKCGGGVKSIELFRSGALVFSSAIVEFNKKGGVKEALTLAHSVQFGGEFEVLVFGAEDFLENSGKLTKQNKEAPTHSNDKCTQIMQKEEILDKFKKILQDDEEVPLAVISISILTEAISKSKAITLMGLNSELKDVVEVWKNVFQEYEGDTVLNGNYISLVSGCQLFLRFLTRQSKQEAIDFEECKMKLIERGQQMTKISQKSIEKVTLLFEDFIRDDAIIMTHGYSKSVISIFLNAAKKGRRFKVVVTEGRPHSLGYKTANLLSKAGIPVTLIADSSVAHRINTVDFVLSGAEGVVENGGIIDSIGTYQMAIVAKAHKKNFYVASESFKFTRLYPLTQFDVEQYGMKKESSLQSIEKEIKGKLEKEVELSFSQIDYTPPDFVTLLFTDLGIFTPSAVSDELIKLYY
eukprot:gene2645-3842_t